MKQMIKNLYKGIKNERTVLPDLNSNTGELTEYSLPVRLYIIGGIMSILGIVNLFLIVGKIAVNPFFYLLFYSIPSNMAVSLFPHEPIVILYGKQYDIILVSIICGIGTVIAAFLDHIFFTPILNHQKLDVFKTKAIYKKVIYFFNKSPFLTIAIGGFTPIPFFPIKLLSFSARYPLVKYLTAVFIGRFPRYYLLAAFGEMTLLPDWIIWLLMAVLIVIGICGSF